MIKVLYQPVSILISVLGGVLAGAIFKRIWKIAADRRMARRGRQAAGAAGQLTAGAAAWARCRQRWFS